MVVLKGSSPVALTAGILLLSRSRSLGVPVSVAIDGDPGAITPVFGPAVVYSHVLASCGVGRRLGLGALVVVPGPPSDPVLLSLEVPREGGPWFAVDGSGDGLQPATAAFSRLVRDPRPEARVLARDLARALELAGIPPEPALLDLLFGAPLPLLQRVGLAQRAGRELTGQAPEPVRSWLAPGEHLGLSFPADPLQAHRTGDLAPWLGRLRPRARLTVESWLDRAVRVGGDDLAVLGRSLGPILAEVVALPSAFMLPPLEPVADAVAVGLARVLGAPVGDEADANATLASIFRFLGGRFVSGERYVVDVPCTDPPADRLARWRWFTEGVLHSADHAEDLWRSVVDPSS